MGIEFSLRFQGVLVSNRVLICVFAMAILLMESALGRSAKTNLDSEQTKDSLAAPASARGSWLGFGTGIQTNRGPLSDRWTLAFGYEYRFSKGFAVPVQFQIYRSLQTGMHNPFLLIAALKGYAHFSSQLQLFAQGGFQVGSLLLGVSLHYSVGTTFLFTRNSAVYLEVRGSNLRPEIDYFILLGVSFRVSGTKN